MGSRRLLRIEPGRFLLWGVFLGVAVIFGPRYIHAQPPARDQAGEAALRHLDGKHLRLITDLESRPDVDELPEVFDAAVLAWTRFWPVSEAQLARFRPTAYLMRDKQIFQRAGLFPEDLPPFPAGYQRQGHIWLYEQPVPYYQRHLLLHEGIHAFMQELLGGSGPPWFSEGMAEYLALHRWSEGRIEVAINPVAPEEVPFWGRIKLIRQAEASGKAMSLLEVVRLGPDAHRRVEAYAWSWAAVFFLDNHPQYRSTFREVWPYISGDGTRFTEELVHRFGDRWTQVQLEWNVFVGECEFGYDVARAAIQFLPPRPLQNEGTQVDVRADRGWIVTGIRLEAGHSYHFEAEGRYQLAQQPKPWWCEPQGITLHYYRGRPLGILMASIQPDAEPTRLTDPIPIGRSATWQPPQSGILCLKINDSPALLADNAGSLTLTIRP